MMASDKLEPEDQSSAWMMTMSDAHPILSMFHLLSSVTLNSARGNEVTRMHDSASMVEFNILQPARMERMEIVAK
ncbi:hypothetical protein RB195_003417 [Necator americanus]|uniref:Uncharacterized protein n=1 Tax=Necator americanus TaxID=51031 RepID=A0ABR1DNH2_NECAM